MIMTGLTKMTAKVESGVLKGKTVEIVGFSSEQSFGSNMLTYAICLYEGFLRSVEITNLVNVKYEPR